MRRSLVIVILVVALVLLLPAAAWPRATAYPCPASAVVYATQDLGDGSTAALLVQAADMGRGSFCEVWYVIYTGEAENSPLAFAAVGDTVLSAPAFRATGSALRAATLTVTVPMWQFDVSGEDETGTPWGDATVKLSWKGTGPISADRQRSTLIDEDTGLPFTIISRGRMRDAIVTGTALLPYEISWTLSGESGNLAASHEVNISSRH
jgi:hypothetical protein